MVERVDCIVVGAGVIGLAVARELACSGRDVIVLERNDRIGAETTARNSEVIHAGLYYRTDSLKARLCVEGKHALYRYCEERNVQHQRIGKLIVAIDDSQIERLAAIAEQAEINGVTDLEKIGAAELKELEPEVEGAAALLSPSTGIVDVDGLVRSLEADLLNTGGTVALRSAVEALSVTSDGVRVITNTDDMSTELVARLVVNAAGLEAIALAATSTFADAPPVAYYAKGSYFSYRGRCPFQRLVYPLPIAGGLGIHATIDLAGRLRFGPDVEWISAPEYSVDPARAGAFYESIRTYWPGLPDDSLLPDYAGVRPKLVGPGEPAADFRIEIDAQSDDAKLVHLLGFESPGLTSCFAIAELVRNSV